MTNYAIVASNITKTYKGINIDVKEKGIGLWISNIFKLTSNKAQPMRALSKVSFNINEGEIFGIYGANGAGKTTLIKILSGLLNPDSGELWVNGSDDNYNIKNSISYVSTNGWMGLEWQLTARENLIMYGNFFMMDPLDLEKRCDEVLELIGMSENADKFISQLSAGMRQKLTIARGLLINKSIIYLDEPTVSLDVNAAKDLRKIIKYYSVEQNKTMIISSHSPEDLAICKRIMFLNKGEVVFVGNQEALFAPLKIRKVVALKCQDLSEEILATIKEMDIIHLNAYSSSGMKQYTMVEIIVDHDMHLINQIVDQLLSHEVTILNMNIGDVSLQDMYLYYINLQKNQSDESCVK